MTFRNFSKILSTFFAFSIAISVFAASGVGQQIVVPNSGQAVRPTPAGQQALISGTPWINGRGLIQGTNWRDNYQIIHDILAGMGTWDANGTYVAKAGPVDTSTVGGVPLTKTLAGKHPLNQTITQTAGSSEIHPFSLHYIDANAVSQSIFQYLNPTSKTFGVYSTAFGGLYSVNVATGETVWSRQFSQALSYAGKAGVAINSRGVTNTAASSSIAWGDTYISNGDDSAFDTGYELGAVFNTPSSSTNSQQKLVEFKFGLSPNSTTTPFGFAMAELSPVNRGNDTGFYRDITIANQHTSGIYIVPEVLNFGNAGEGKNITFSFGCLPSGSANSTSQPARTYACLQANPNSLVPTAHSAGSAGGGRLVSASGGSVDDLSPAAVVQAWGFWNHGLDFSTATLNGGTMGATNGDALHLATGQRILFDTAGNVALSYNGSLASLGTGLTVQDSATQTFPAGFITQANSQLTQIGINDSSFGTQVTASQGGFLRIETRAGLPLFEFWGRAANGSLANPFSIDVSGNLNTSGSYQISGVTVVDGTRNVTAASIRTSDSPNVSGAGTTQATATALTSDINEVTTCASGAGVVLRPWAGITGMAAPQEVFIAPGVASACLAYPPAGAHIEFSTTVGATNAPVSLAIGAHARFVCSSATLCRQAP